MFSGKRKLKNRCFWNGEDVRDLQTEPPTDVPQPERPDRRERPDRPVPVRSSYTEDDDFIEDWNESENEGEEFEGEE